ncbi:MAG: hypothetical protein ACRBN8_40105 [Nannocystales bacterium]
MSDEPTLRQAVLDDPDAEAPRVDYAAWCDQQPDVATQARGEFIRLQIGLEKYTPGGTSRGDQRLRMFELSDRFANTWAQPLAPWVSKREFHRGFVEYVTLSAANFLAHAKDLFALAPIRHVDLTDVRNVNESLFASPWLATLRSLGMDAVGLHDIHMQLLGASPHAAQLGWLSAEDNHLTTNSYAALAASTTLPRLRFARFSGNTVDPVEQLGMDGEEVVAVHMPDEGVALEQQHGHLEWLHRDGKSESRFAY